MPRLQPQPLKLTEEERQVLEQFVSKHSAPQQLALRARIILLADEGLNHREIARKLGISRDMTRLWRRRWLALTPQEVPVLERLEDAPRPGAPRQFTEEQIAQLYAIACEDPRDSGRPISHWTRGELADEMAKRGVVESISPRHVDRLLEQADLKPHQVRYWLTPAKDDQFDEKVADICETYRTAPEREKRGSEPSAPMN